jgi:hypothetical protein
VSDKMRNILRKEKLLLLLIIVVSLGSITLYAQHLKHDDDEKLIQVTVLSALFQVHSNYDSIKISNDPTINELIDIQKKLKIIQENSSAIDNFTETPLLVPISEAFTQLINLIISNYNKNQDFSNEDLDTLSIVITESKNLPSLLSGVYYAPHRRGEEVDFQRAKKKISNYGELTALYNRILAA